MNKQVIRIAREQLVLILEKVVTKELLIVYLAIPFSLIGQPHRTFYVLEDSVSHKSNAFITEMRPKENGFNSLFCYNLVFPEVDSVKNLVSIFLHPNIDGKYWSEIKSDVVRRLHFSSWSELEFEVKKNIQDYLNHQGDYQSFLNVVLIRKKGEKYFIPIKSGSQILRLRSSFNTELDFITFNFSTKRYKDFQDFGSGVPIFEAADRIMGKMIPLKKRKYYSEFLRTNRDFVHYSPNQFYEYQYYPFVDSFNSKFFVNCKVGIVGVCFSKKNPGFVLDKEIVFYPRKINGIQWKEKLR
ncbi:hypothetical protein [Jiulongibacter sp. NS-SX5]|uniref:hypothetical protein n=1 Tax=Jiulongibacter sp. NS-SX5 TaxID=3463854 RepID=UPI004057FE92